MGEKMLITDLSFYYNLCHKCSCTKCQFVKEFLVSKSSLLPRQLLPVRGDPKSVIQSPLFMPLFIVFAVSAHLTNPCFT